MSIPVAIAGAGPIGLAVALRLANAGISVLVFDKQSAPQPRATQDARVVVLNHFSKALLTDLEVWSLLADKTGPIEAMCLSAPGVPTQGRFSKNDTGFDGLGDTVFNQDISCALAEIAQQHPKINLHWMTAIEQLERLPDAVVINGVHRAVCLIAADGGQSAIRRLLRLTPQLAPYQQSAHVATIETQKPHNRIAYQWFLPDGPLAFLPLTPANQISIVWTQTQSAFEKHQVMQDESFCRALSVASDHQLGFVTTVGKRFHFPLKAQWLGEAVQPRIVFVGDAWHSIHPLAGQGMNLGFQDVQALSDTLIRAFRAGADLGALPVLRRYENVRIGKNRQMQQLMSAINRLGAIKGGCMPWAQNVGFGVLNRWPWLREWLVAQAQGE